VEKTGEGQLTFNPLGVDATLVNPTPPPQSIDIIPGTTGLAFRVEAPEPSTWVMLTIAALTWAVYRLKRRK
jgi:hypothetical protein